VKKALRTKLGRPPVLTGTRLDDLCDLLATGLTDITTAAKTLKVARATVYNTINRGQDPGGRIEKALAAGRAARRDARHGTESCYTHLGCDRPECKAAATKARAQRRERTADLPEPIPLPTPAPAAASTAAALYAALTTPLADAS
jgi:hypothetical protein